VLDFVLFASHPWLAKRFALEITLKNFINSKEKIEEILIGTNLGFLSLYDKDHPYTIPITYGYMNGRIIFHCNMNGKKLELIKKNNNVCFVVSNQFGHFVPHPQGAKCHAHSNSVICYGKARIIDDIEERCSLLNVFNKCIVDDAREIKIDEVKGCYAVEIKIEEMTARVERESQCGFYQYRFK
jgi:nitroimidazol reductase NimA-like FMN-containing flavoprotein (pyridoxamine 5'-phosphate oxidase superfamily)